jgi:hypothetical protein
VGNLTLTEVILLLLTVSLILTKHNLILTKFNLILTKLILSYGPCQYSFRLDSDSDLTTCKYFPQAFSTGARSLPLSFLRCVVGSGGLPKLKVSRRCHGVDLVAVGMRSLKNAPSSTRTDLS